MRTRTIPSRKDVLIILISTILLLINFGAIGKRGRRRAKEVVCLSNLRQWGIVLETCIQDNGGYFLSGVGGGSGLWWVEPLEPYYENDRLLLCPECKKVASRGIGELSDEAWTSNKYTGGYCPNGWTCNPQPGVSSVWGVWGRGPVDDYWRTPHVPGASNIPAFSDAWYVDAWPRHIDMPPETEFGPPDRTNIDEMQRVCVNRHCGAVNILFMDWSVKKIGLKQLWKLKWNRQFETDGPWTKAGGCKPDDWPQWMKDFKDF